MSDTTKDPQYVITYPVGGSVMVDGTIRDNSLIAKDFLTALVNGTNFIVPFHGWKVAVKQPDGTWIVIAGSDHSIGD